MDRGSPTLPHAPLTELAYVRALEARFSGFDSLVGYMGYTDKVKFNEYRNRWSAKRREFWNDLKAGPCMDCGLTYPPYVMQWDHRNPAEKEFTVARNWQYSKARVLAEIAKCDLVCANCHAERTHKRASSSEEEQQVFTLRVGIS